MKILLKGFGMQLYTDTAADEAAGLLTKGAAGLIKAMLRTGEKKLTAQKMLKLAWHHNWMPYGGKGFPAEKPDIIIELDPVLGNKPIAYIPD